jgi:hypothetical protein
VDDTSWKYSSDDICCIETSAALASFTGEKVSVQPFCGDKKVVSEKS